jgi:hypothetical protein
MVILGSAQSGPNDLPIRIMAGSLRGQRLQASFEVRYVCIFSECGLAGSIVHTSMGHDEICDEGVRGRCECR